MCIAQIQILTTSVGSWLREVDSRSARHSFPRFARSYLSRSVLDTTHPRVVVLVIENVVLSSERDVSLPGWESTHAMSKTQRTTRECGTLTNNEMYRVSLKHNTSTTATTTTTTIDHDASSFRLCCCSTTMRQAQAFDNCDSVTAYPFTACVYFYKTPRG